MLFGNKKKTAFINACVAPDVFDKIVSLGGSCQVAHQLKRLRLRFDSYPFDWVFSTNADRVIELMRNDFSEYLLEENLSELEREDSEHRSVLDTRYGIIHQHVFPRDKSVSEAYSEVKATVDRRVERFRGLKGKILFVRTNLTVKQAEELSSVLISRFGRGAFLLVLNHTRSFNIKEIAVSAPNLRMLEIYDENENTGQNWRGYDPHWDAVLGNVRAASELVDLGDGSVFRKGFYGAEVDGRGQKFRWSEKACALDLTRYGGASVRIEFSCPTDTAIEIKNVYGETVKVLAAQRTPYIELRIDHATRVLDVTVDRVFIPSSHFDTDDNRPLGICINRLEVTRGH